MGKNQKFEAQNVKNVKNEVKPKEAAPAPKGKAPKGRK